MSASTRPPVAGRPTESGLRGAVQARLADPAALALWGIVLLAAVVRLAYLDVIEFKGDEAGHLARALQIVEAHQLPFVGSQASVGIAKPPMMSVLMAIPLLFGRDPRLASAFIALLNVGAVAGCFLVVRRYYGLRAAVVAGVLFAANPWAVILSRKVFTADVLAPFLVLYFYALHAALVDRQPWGWLLAVLSLGIAVSITFSPLPLALVLAAAIVAYGRRVPWGHLLAGAGLVLLLFIPYLYAEAGRLQDVVAVLSSKGHAGSAAPGTSALQAATWLHSGRNIGSLAGAAFAAFAPAHSPLRGLDGLAALLFAAGVVGVVAMAVEARVCPAKRSMASRYALLALWLVAALGVVSLGIVRVETQYLVILYPAGFVAMALLTDRAWEALEARRGRRAVWARLGQLGLGSLLVAVVAWQAYCVFYLYGFVAGHDTAGGYGVPLRSWLAIRDMVRREAAATGVDEVWAIVDGTDVAYEQTPAILNYLLGPDLKVTFLGQGGNEALLLPAGRPALYLLTRTVPPEVERMLSRIGAEERGALPAAPGGVGARVLFAPGRTAEQLRSLISQPVSESTLDSGLVLLGYDWPAGVRPGDTVRFATYWSLRDIPAAERWVAHSLFNHLLAADGSKLAQHDGFGLPERYWQPGLMLVQWFQLELPASMPQGDYTLLTGMYRLSELSANHVLDQAGAPAGDAIRLGPVHVGE